MVKSHMPVSSHRFPVPRPVIAKVMNRVLAAYVIGAILAVSMWFVPGLAVGDGVPITRTFFTLIINSIFAVWAFAGWAYAARYVFGGEALYVDADRLVFLFPAFRSIRLAEITSVDVRASDFWNTFVEVQLKEGRTIKLPTFIVGDPDEVYQAVRAAAGLPADA